MRYQPIKLPVLEYNRHYMVRYRNTHLHLRLCLRSRVHVTREDVSSLSRLKLENDFQNIA